MKRHTTGVLHLEWSADGKRLFSSGGVEELLVFRVRTDDTGCIGVVEESFLPVPKQEAETRICGLDVLQYDGVHCVAAGMSDGLVKVWTYQENVWTWKVTAVYGTCCLLHAKFVPVASEGKLALLVAATDGHLAIYEVDGLTMRQVWRQRVHQSGIKALSVDPSPTGVTVFTGGDDCAIASTTVEYTKNSWMTVECNLVERAHASAVTAILTVTGGEGRVITAGVDQRVKMWNRRLEAVGSVNSMVTDLGGAVAVDTEAGNAVVVVGVGIEAWRVGEMEK